MVGYVLRSPILAKVVEHCHRHRSPSLLLSQRYQVHVALTGVCELWWVPVRNRLAPGALNGVRRCMVGVSLLQVESRKQR